MEENKQHKTALPETEPIPSAQAPEALLDIRGLRVEYHTDEDVVYAVNGLDLTIGKGETPGSGGRDRRRQDHHGPVASCGCIAGPAGKDHGRRDLVRRARICSRPSPHRLREIRGSKISMIFQDPMTSLNPVLHRGRSDRGGASSQHDKCSKEEAGESARRYAGDGGHPPGRAMTSIPTSSPAA